MSNKYGVILADPAWKYSNSGIHGAAANHYDTMSNEDIANLPVSSLAASDSVLILWVTWPHVATAIKHVLPSWGFEYVTGFPWVKMSGVPQVNLWGEIEFRPSWGQGWWVRGVTEVIMIAKRGNAKYPETMFMGLLSERFRHSRKPDNIYQYAESFPGPYLELFARRPRAGWHVWGNEVVSDIELLAGEK